MKEVSLLPSLINPDTRASLLMRLRGPRDDDAWMDFDCIYEPVIYTMACRRGLQDADAREIVQEVLLRVTSAIEQFDHRGKGSLRGWLSTLTRNETVNRIRRVAASGEIVDASGVRRRMDATAADMHSADSLEAEFQEDHRRHLFRLAAAEIRGRTSETNWKAFWMTSVEGVSVPRTAKLLNLDAATVTASGMIAGTPCYMSPEQACGDVAAEASDWFSFGSLLYALSTGRPPHRAECPLAVLRKISDVDAKPIHEINESMPAWINVLVSQFMDRDITRRIGNGNEAVTLLRAAHRHVTNPSANPLPTTIQVPKTYPRFILVAGAMITALVCIGAITFMIGRLGSGGLSKMQTTGQAPSALINLPAFTLPAQPASQPVVSTSNDSQLSRIETRWRDHELEQSLFDLQLEISKAER